MSKRASKRSLWTTVAITGAVLTLAFGGFRYFSPEGVLARSYGQVLGDIDTSWGSRHKGNVWLSGTRAPAGVQASPIGTAGQLAIGDRITVAARAGGQQAIEVVALEEIDGAALGLAGTRFQIVTGRSAEADAESTVVRFLFAVEQPVLKPAVSGGDRIL